MEQKIRTQKIGNRKQKIGNRKKTHISREQKIDTHQFFHSISGPDCIKSQRLKAAKTELRICVKVEVAVLGFPWLISLMVSVDVKQH